MALASADAVLRCFASVMARSSTPKSHLERQAGPPPTLGRVHFVSLVAEIIQVEGPSLLGAMHDRQLLAFRFGVDAYHVAGLVEDLARHAVRSGRNVPQQKGRRPGVNLAGEGQHLNRRAVLREILGQLEAPKESVPMGFRCFTASASCAVIRTVGSNPTLSAR